MGGKFCKNIEQLMYIYVFTFIYLIFTTSKVHNSENSVAIMLCIYGKTSSNLSNMTNIHD